MPLLMHLRMRFSNRHENDDWESVEIMRKQHYQFIFMTVLKRIPLLTDLLTDIQSKAKTKQGLSSVVGPGNWPAIEAVTLQSLTNTTKPSRLPPGTPVPMTKTAWMLGWDAAMKQSGDPPRFPQFNRPLFLGQYIHFLLVITQWLCPIYLKRLFRDSDLEDIFTVAAAMMTLPFDHCTAESSS